MTMIPTPAQGGDSRTPAHLTPEYLDGLLFRGGLKVLRRGSAGNLPPQIERYLNGTADELPADLSAIPERMRPLLSLMRSIGDRVRSRAEPAQDEAAAEMRAADEARAVLQRIARRAAGDAA